MPRKDKIYVEANTAGSSLLLLCFLICIWNLSFEIDSEENIEEGLMAVLRHSFSSPLLRKKLSASNNTWNHMEVASNLRIFTFDHWKNIEASKNQMEIS